MIPPLVISSSSHVLRRLSRPKWREKGEEGSEWNKLERTTVASQSDICLGRKVPARVAIHAIVYFDFTIERTKSVDYMI